MNPMQRRRARLLISRAQSFADEPLRAAANFTWVGSAVDREGLAAGLPSWSVVGVGATRLFVVAAEDASPDRAVALFGSWPLEQVRLSEAGIDRMVGAVKVGTHPAIRFEFPDRADAFLQPVGREVDDVLTAYRAARPTARPATDAAEFHGLTEVALMTASADEGAYFVLTHLDGTTTSVPLGQGDDLAETLRTLPGFDAETFDRARTVTVQGMAVLWRVDRASPLD